MTRRFLIAVLEFVSLVISPGRWSSTVVIAFLAIVGAGYVALDVYQIATGTVDIGRHWPGVMPAVMAVFIVIVRLTDRADNHSATKRVE